MIVLLLALLITQEEDAMWESICAEYERRMEDAECEMGCDPDYYLDPA